MIPHSRTTSPAMPDFIEQLLNWFDKRFLDWVLAIVIVLSVMAGLVLATLAATIYMVYQNPDVAVRWGWMQRWASPTGPTGTHPLVCSDSPAAEKTQLYQETLAETPFHFENIEIKQISQHHIIGTARVVCTVGDTSIETKWEGEFVTRFDLPLGICIDEIRVKTHATTPCPTP
jgi:hypothetical protein